MCRPAFQRGRAVFLLVGVVGLAAAEAFGDDLSCQVVDADPGIAAAALGVCGDVPDAWAEEEVAAGESRVDGIAP